MEPSRRSSVGTIGWLGPMWLLAVLLCGGAAAAPARADGSAVGLSFLHVGGVAGPAALRQVVDVRGRGVLLRGVNVNGLRDVYQASLAPPYPTTPAAYRDGRCPAPHRAGSELAVCRSDAGQIAGLGYDSVRLTVSWSLLEPRPGRIDHAYIDRIAQVVGWLRARGVYTIIDMHQDAWSKYLYTPASQRCVAPSEPVTGPHEADGAPAWASAHVSPVCALDGVRELDPAVQEDFQRFWSDAPGPDGVGLQEHYAAVVVALARRFGGDPAVAGYDLFNEPSPGLLAPQVMDRTELFPFYAKVIASVRREVRGFRQLFFVEPDITRDITDRDTPVGPWSRYSPYRNVVYEPHVYTHVFTPDAELGQPSLAALFPLGGGYDHAAAGARALGLPLWVGEFGNFVKDDGTLLRGHYENQDALAIGSSLWVWKDYPASSAEGFSVQHPPYRRDGRGTFFASHVKFSSRAYPIYTAGSLQALRYQPDRHDFAMRGRSGPVRVGDRARATVIFLPGSVRRCLTATGARLRQPRRTGARYAYAYPRGGAYRIYTTRCPRAHPGEPPRTGETPTPSTAGKAHRAHEPPVPRGGVEAGQGGAARANRGRPGARSAPRVLLRCIALQSHGDPRKSLCSSTGPVRG